MATQEAVGAEALLEKARGYLGGEDLQLLERAWRAALEAHSASKPRENGEPFVSHPLATAEILTELRADAPTLAAGLLHDVLEDSSGLTKERLEREFGHQVTRLVEGVTKLTLASRGIRPRARQAENLRRMLIAMAEDPRVLLVKLADRLHNMRTLDALPPERRRANAEETLRIYAPLAHRFGVWTLKWQLEDLAFRELEPEAYRSLAARVASTRREREAEVEADRQLLQETLNRHGIEAQVFGRSKHLYSVYRKMREQDVDFDNIYDLTGLRVVCNDRNTCYTILAIIHNELWPPVPGMFSDYIASPKANGYQSLHLKALKPNDQIIEIQIRTWEMHQVAEFGMAAHWAYKEGAPAEKPVRARVRDAAYQDNLRKWLRQLGELQDDEEFLAAVGVELSEAQVFVFTPEREVIALPAGSTPIDFAYRVHTDIGNHCQQAKVNGALVGLDHPLQTGDVVRIVTHPRAHPKEDWLSYARTSQARQKIRHWLSREHERENIRLGRERLQRELDQAHISQEEWAPFIEYILPHLNLRSEERLLEAIGAGQVSGRSLVNRFRERATRGEEGEIVGRPTQAAPQALPVAVLSPDAALDKLEYHLARCCSPIPGDEIVGYVSRGRGLVVHQAECRNLRERREREPARYLPLQWRTDAASPALFEAQAIVKATDRPGLLRDLTALVGSTNADIAAARIVSRQPPFAFIELVLNVRDHQHLSQVLRNLLKMEEVTSVARH
jgi:GTP pyrophosphokinase